MVNASTRSQKYYLWFKCHNDFSVVSCVVTPGFDYHFELFTQQHYRAISRTHLLLNNWPIRSTENKTISSPTGSLIVFHYKASQLLFNFIKHFCVPTPVNKGTPLMTLSLIALGAIVVETIIS